MFQLTVQHLTPIIFQGKIEELIYLGDHIRARLDVCGNNEFIVKVPNEGSFSHKEGDQLKFKLEF